MRTELGENNITNSTLATQHQQQQHQQQQQQHKMSPAAIFMGNQPNWVLKLVLGLNQNNENNNPERKHRGTLGGNDSTKGYPVLNILFKILFRLLGLV